MTISNYEYVVVGSGAGGGILAARLAELGHKVLLLEAGGDPLDAGSPPAPGTDRLPADYEVPAFHPFASENEAMKWDFFVRHYQSDERQKKDPKYYQNWQGRYVDGVLYPRAGTLGGCTSHHALFTVYPHNKDWDDIAELTGDPSWSAQNMRKYFEQMERCEYRDCSRLLAKVGINPSRHGYSGWLPTEMPLPLNALKKDKRLIRTIVSSIEQAAITNDQDRERFKWAIEGKFDPNDWRLVAEDAVGIRYAPLSSHRGRRYGARERVLEVAARFPDRLHYELNALATRILLDESNKAFGVEYLKGTRLYQAHSQPSMEPGTRKQVVVSGEVILAGGAFNTPQLLKLSGIGPCDELRRFGIPVRVDLPGVGTNLQDRYEMGVVYRMNFPAWEVLQDAKYMVTDPQYKAWVEKRDGVYTTNGTILAVIKRSAERRLLPDLFIFALLGMFKGYFPNYSSLIAENLNTLTWAILKAHTKNHAGTVQLRSADPLDVPKINFSYFEEGNDHEGEDLQSVVEGIKFVRTLAQPLIDDGLISEEEVPGTQVASDEQLSEFIKNNAWGHHASCSCPIGDPACGGVVNGNFEVHGTRSLRIVDASVFPKIPGFFIVTSIYMIAEKAADVISAASARRASGG